MNKLTRQKLLQRRSFLHHKQQENSESFALEAAHMNYNRITVMFVDTSEAELSSWCATAAFTAACGVTGQKEGFR